MRRFVVNAMVEDPNRKLREYRVLADGFDMSFGVANFFVRGFLGRKTTVFSIKDPLYVSRDTDWGAGLESKSY